VSELEVQVRVEGSAARLTLNRPRALNALTADMCEAINEALLALRDDERVQLVLFDGAGDRAFCAGGDIRRVAESGAGDGVEAARFFRSEYRMNELLFRYPKPVVAIMDGITMGGGVGISMPARYRIATERTLWAMPEGDIGLFPDVGGGWSLARLPGQTGAWLALAGARLKAADCCALGIATHFVPSEHVDGLVASLSSAHPGEGRDPGRVIAEVCGQGAASSTAISGQAPASLVLGPGLRRDERNGESPPIAGHREAIDRLFCFDTVEEIMAALRADGSEWAKAQADFLARKCPTTLKVALRLIREGAQRTSFAEEMAVEYRLAVRMTRRHDFIDGVRAVLVDKDNAPRWDPPALEGVTDAQLDQLFTPLPAQEQWTPLA
jgi:enoyl-CoA hydratase